MFSPNAETNAVKRDYQHIEVTPYGAALGAVVTGVDLRNPTEEQMAEIKWAITDHSGVLEILCQFTNLAMRGLTYDRQVRF